MKAQKNFEMDIVNPALNAFQKETGIQVEFFPENHLPRDLYQDGTLRIGEVENEQVLNVEIKTTINEVTIGRLAQFNRMNPEGNILITKFVPLYLTKKMKEQHIQFIDTVGNAYITRPPMFVYINGNKITEQKKELTTEGMYGVAGIRVIFAFLCKQNLENATYREIAEAAGVALGTVAGIMKYLTEHQYLIDLEDRGRRLVKKKELMEKWTEMYTTKFRWRRLIGRYAVPKEQFWRDIDLGPLDAFWGGEIAAQKLTHYLKPEIITIYTRKPIDGLIMKLKLRKDENGPIELREVFWNFIPDKEDPIVPPLLVYADLMAVGDTRTIDAAAMVNDEYLKRYFQQT